MFLKKEKKKFDQKMDHGRGSDQKKKTNELTQKEYKEDPHLVQVYEWQHNQMDHNNIDLVDQDH